MPALGETARQRRETESGQSPGLGEAVRSRCTPSHPLRIDLRALPCVWFAVTAHYPLRSPAPSRHNDFRGGRPTSGANRGLAFMSPEPHNEFRIINNTP